MYPADDTSDDVHLKLVDGVWIIKIIPGHVNATSLRPQLPMAGGIIDRGKNLERPKSRDATVDARLGESSASSICLAKPSKVDMQRFDVLGGGLRLEVCGQPLRSRRRRAQRNSPRRII